MGLVLCFGKLDTNTFLHSTSFFLFISCVIDLIALLFALCLCGYVNTYVCAGVYAHMGVDAEDWCLLPSSISLHLML